MAGGADLQAGDLMLRLGTQGGVIAEFRHRDRALLSATPQGACFPLVPWGNRVRGNRIAFAGASHVVAPNVPPEPLHLHGEGWQAPWTIRDIGPAHALLCHSHDGPGLPHRYDCEQGFALTPDGLRLTLSVTNTGAETLPFGLGWHPFFPPGARLTAPACTIWAEGPDLLPAAPQPLPPDLDFATPRALPARRINAAFDGWTGTARLDWPDLSLLLTTDPVLRYFQLYQPEGGQSLAFEPMSHLPGGVDGPDLGGLTPLAPGESLRASMTLTLHTIPGDPL